MKYQFENTRRVLPYMSKDAVDMHFLIDRLNADPDFLKEILKKKNDFLVESTKSLYGPVVSVLPFGRWAKKAMATQFNFGFGDETNQLSLKKYYPAEYSPTYRDARIRTDVYTTSAALSFAAVSAVGLAVGLVLAATGVLGVLQGVIVGLGVGMGVGAMAGGVVGHKMRVKFEKYCDAAYSKGGEVAKEALKDTKDKLQLLEEREKSSFQDRYAVRTPGFGPCL